MKKKPARRLNPPKESTPEETAREIQEFMARHRLDDLVIEDGKQKIEVRSGTPNFYAPVSPRSSAHETPPPAAAPASPYLQIRSPMAGTFYRAPSPNSELYVKEGDKLTPDTTVCVIEAMKVMNEIKAEVAGKLVKICLENAASVENGKRLFLIYCTLCHGPDAKGGGPVAPKFIPPPDLTLDLFRQRSDG